MDKTSTELNLLRIKAEAQLTSAKEPELRSADELLHELHVHQVELEIQNEDLRHAHAALEDAYDRYVDLYDFAPVGYLTLTREGVITEANLTAANLLGTDRKKLLKRRFSAFVNSRDADGWHLFFSNIIKQGQRKHTELTLTCSDGADFCAQLDCLRVTSAEQSPMLRIALTDISERKHTESALREVEAHTLAIALACAEMGSWDWDIKTGQVTFNERWAAMRGLRLENIEPHIDSWEKAIHPDDFPTCDAALMAHLENRTPFFQAEYRVRTPSGVWVWLSNRSTVVKRDSEGNPLRMAGIEMDITERKHHDEERRIAAIAFDCKDGMMVTDANAVIIRVNRSFTRLTGYSAAEAVGRTPQLLSSGRHDKGFYQRMWNTLKDKGFWQGEIWNRRKDGAIYAEWLHISAVTANNGDITHYVGSFSNITTNKTAAAEIHRLAYYDPITLLPNRRLFQERLGRALAASGKDQNYGALLFIDLDNFKVLNDTLGHDMGDMLLTQVAARLIGCMHENDTVARQGGDEFVVMLEQLGRDREEATVQAGRVGERILAVLNQVYQFADYEYHSTPSIGITLFNDHQDTVDELLKRADIAMYAAKAAGRNTLRFFDPEMQAAVIERAMLEADLHRALTENQFKLYFQLQAHHDHQITGAEVLLRWEHPERGLISPLDFIPLAEETRLILPIGLWVLEAACAQLKIWADIPQFRHLQLAVNVSVHQFHQDCFVEQVCAVLEKYSVQPHLLKLELTESLILDNVEDNIIKMQALKKIGVHFSMDDFGTGYSSLAYLTQLPLNQLKIDQSFVRNIGVKATDAVIVQTIIGMANNLGIEVIAEGVETEEQRAFLEQHGCPSIQGYLFGKPSPLEDFQAFLGKLKDF
ncbi:MAG: EAL domain-containing protein [Methylobacter sp.]|nr:EAL domain-containing protein [Methylobacter sp.]MDP2099167.1 EAL domain-containing protein [Methylobacter sp.]MDP2429993.1 EAL domain-containing protein [Methylobacter sp.]MDP3054838.1 EAL domain-containing protein [Methylobacter sp.]MDP3360582.1 EAL domain-containing protein [Methylobacter sp.]